MKKETKINLLEYNYPQPTLADIAFPTFDTISELLEEAKLRGFCYNYNGPYNKLFMKLFYEGGRVVFKKDVDSDKQEKIWKYVRSFMGSWSPKHEHKEAICAMLLSEIVEPELAKD